MEPEPDRTVPSPELQDALLSWWKELGNIPGDQAALRHCRNLREVAITPAFHRLTRRLEPSGPMSPDQVDRLALVAGVLSQVKENKPDVFEKNIKRSFAVQMVRPPQKWGRGTTACVSDLKFRKLLKIEVPDNLYTTMIGIVRCLEGSVDLAGLAYGISRWNKQTKKEWAYAYYETAPREKKQGVR
jgi:CRISPR system Cascade subunit CasB